MSQCGDPRTGAAALALLVGALLLSACGGATEPTPATDAPAGNLSTPAGARATAAASAPAPGLPATATPAGNPASIAATGTALSATSRAFIGSAAPVVTLSTAPPSDPRAQAVVDAARARFDQVTALHFLLTVAGDAFLDAARTERLQSAEGDLIRPDRVSLTAKIAVGTINAQLKFIQIGDNAYLTDILTGKWAPAPAGLSYDPRLVFDRDNGIPAILAQGRGWMPAGVEQVNGVTAQHVRAPVPAATVNALTGATLRGDTVDVDLYVEPKNNDVLRLVIAERPEAVPAGGVATRWMLDLSRQNETITIDTPTVGG